MTRLVQSEHKWASASRLATPVRLSCNSPMESTDPVVCIDGPETTDIVIYGETSTLLHPPPLQLSSAATSTSGGPPPLSIRVARITPAPRAPRPDDPTPRQPPVHILGSTTLADLGANKRIIQRSSTGQVKGKAKEKDKMEDPVLRRARDVMLHLPRPNVNGRGKEKERNPGQREAGFKVPELPAKVRRKQGTGTDVFGTVTLPEPQSGKCERKTVVVDGDNAVANPVEDANKLVCGASLALMPTRKHFSYRY